MYLCQKTYVPMSKNFCAYVHKKLMCLCLRATLRCRHRGIAGCGGDRILSVLPHK